MSDVDVDIHDAVALVAVVDGPDEDGLKAGAEVATAPPVSPAPAAAPTAGGTRAGQAAGGGVDRAVGQPDGAEPAVAVRTNSFPRGIWRQRGVYKTQAGKGFLGGASFTVPSVGTLIVTGAVPSSQDGGTATGFKMSTDDGTTFYDVLDGKTVSAGARFKFAEPVYPGDEIDFCTAQNSAVDALRIMFQQDITTSQVQSVNTTTADVNVTEINGQTQTAANWSALLAAPDTDIKNTASTVGTTPDRIDSGLSNRRYVVVVNNGTQTIYVGDSAVTVGTGLPVKPGASATVTVGPSVAIYAISGTAGQDVRAMEVA